MDKQDAECVQSAASIGADLSRYQGNVFLLVLIAELEANFEGSRNSSSGPFCCRYDSSGSAIVRGEGVGFGFHDKLL